MTKKTAPIRVLIVDDSLFMRTLLTEIIKSDPRLIVVGTAKDGYEAIEKVTQLHPDVITMDVEMPNLDGLQALGYIMSECPTPVVMLSAHTHANAEVTFKALDYGAVDFVPKPAGSISLNIKEIKPMLIDKLVVASHADITKIPLRVDAPHIPFKSTKRAAPTQRDHLTSTISTVVIGASTGGPRALTDILTALPGYLPVSIVVVQHMPPTFTHSFANRLNAISELEIKEAEAGDFLQPGYVYVAPGGFHLELEAAAGGHRITLNRKPALHGVRPSVDITMTSVAEHLGPAVLGVLLTGMGKDGAKGIQTIKKKGGRTLAQNQETSVVFGMPQAAIATGAVDKIVPLSEMAKEIVTTIKQKHT
ncbi:MAG: chemotaxis response regulator protein-glutamate methylesterase [Gemmatimonadetes bacterium]|nr:MAG: chemotaxis response regulator protein-glutamate methylesterase [Gemmatimonadota bacterium]